jgi:hypothetical protein
MRCSFELEEVGVVRGDGEFLRYGVLASVEQINANMYERSNATLKQIKWGETCLCVTKACP